MYTTVSYGTGVLSNAGVYHAYYTLDGISKVSLKSGTTNLQFEFLTCQAAFDKSDGKEHIVIIFLNRQAASETKDDTIASRIQDTETRIVYIGF